MQPVWSNVYNKVSVSLHNKEFGITQKEVSAGTFLDMVSTKSLRADPEDTLAFERIVEIAEISRESFVNN